VKLVWKTETSPPVGGWTEARQGVAVEVVIVVDQAGATHPTKLRGCPLLLFAWRLGRVGPVVGLGCEHEQVGSPGLESQLVDPSPGLLDSCTDRFLLLRQGLGADLDLLQSEAELIH
jgi:hypothetical protein